MRAVALLSLKQITGLECPKMAQKCYFWVFSLVFGNFDKIKEFYDKIALNYVRLHIVSVILKFEIEKNDQKVVILNF